MSKMIRMIVVFVVCGAMVTSAQAAFEIVSNPHGLDLQAVTADGINGWDWGNDTLQAAYENGQLDVVTPSPVAWGSADDLVDGDGYTDGLVMYNSYTSSFTFNSSYDGPRALGTVDGQWGHAMRIATGFHENGNNYHLIAYYQTTDAPGVWKTLFEVKDLDSQPAWKQNCIYVVSNAESLMIDNINLIAIKTFSVPQSTGGESCTTLTELDVNLVDVYDLPYAFASNASVLSDNDDTVTSPVWVNPATTSLIDTGATYQWLEGDLAGLGSDVDALQNNLGAWSSDPLGAAWSSWDAEDTIFEFDLQKKYLIEQVSLAYVLGPDFDGVLYDRGLGKMTISLSEDGTNYSPWGQWLDDFDPNEVDPVFNRVATVKGNTVGARYVKFEITRIGDSGIMYHQMAIDEAMIWGQEMPDSFGVISNNANISGASWVNTAALIDTGATYTWFYTDTGNDPANGVPVLQSNTTDSAWGTWDGQDKNIFDFDLKEPYLITSCTVGVLFSDTFDGTRYHRGVGRVDVYLSDDGVSFDRWASWVDDDPEDSPAGTANSMYRIDLSGTAATAQYVRYAVSKSGGLADYHQTTIDEAIIWGGTYSIKGDLDADDDVDITDLGILAGDWLSDTTPDISTVDDFESYTATGPGVGTLLNSWAEFPEAPGQSIMTLLTQSADAHAGDQAMRWEYDVPATKWAEVVWIAGSPVNLSLYGELRFWVKRHAGNSEASLLYVKFIEGTSTSEIAAEWYLSQADGSTYADPDEWVELVVDLNDLIFGGTAALGYTQLSDITAVEQIMIGCYYQTTSGVGTIDIDDVRLLEPTVMADGDINRDFHVNLIDFAIMAEHWLETVQ